LIIRCGFSCELSPVFNSDELQITKNKDQSQILVVVFVICVVILKYLLIKVVIYVNISN